MFDKLRARWGVGTLQLALILCTFAIGGSLCGWAARKVMLFADLEKGLGWWLLYLALVTILWPFAVILISVPLGQWSFFKTYLARIARRMGFGKKAVKEGDQVI